MKNLDLTKNEVQEMFKNAIESGDHEAFVKAQVEFAKGIQTEILQEAKQYASSTLDETVMAQRGLNALTTEEKEYYNEVISAGGFAGVEKAVPATVFERVFEYLRANHALLSEITLVNTTGITEWIKRNNDVEGAWWGALTAEIEKKLEVAFKKEKTELFKLSAYVPVAKAMLDLGPEWLDRFVREILAESMAMALELAIIAGTGKEQPIGMMKNLAAPVVEGVYADKTAVALTDLSPASLGEKVMAPLTKGGKRVVNEVLMIVNPLDYWKKIFPNTAVLNSAGVYVHGVLPIPGKVIQSVAVTEGKMIAGMAKDYFMGVGSTQKIEQSDHYKFLEDERTYLAKQYANGKPQDNESFLVFDISDMIVPTVDPQ